MILLALLQTWHELTFEFGGPDDLDRFPWSAPVSVVVMIAVVFIFRKARKNYLALPEIPLAAAVDAQHPDVTVVIPAKNEEQHIARCVQSFPDVRVIVVDGGSTDRTAEKAQLAGAKVIPAPDPVQGVMPRPNALLAGAQLATSNYVLFVEADTFYEAGFAESAVQYAERNQLALISPFLKQICISLPERVLLPYAFALSFCGVNARNVQNVLAPETLVNGHCMLFLRSAYEFFGGHRSVHTSVIEDVAITEKVKRHRMNLQIMRAEHLGSVRMYDSLGAIWRGLGRDSFVFMRVNRRSGLKVMLASIPLISILPLSVWLAWEEQWPFIPVLLIVPVVMLKPWYGGWGRALCYLPAMYLVPCILLHGMIRTLFGIRSEWKPGRL